MRITPILIWLFASLSLTLEIDTPSTSFWSCFIDNAIGYFPSLLIYYPFAFLLKKTSHFFMSFREKPFLWLYLGGLLLIGELLLNHTFYLNEYLFAAFLPFLLKLLEDLGDCTRLSKFIALLIAFVILVLFHEVNMIAFGAALSIWILASCF